MMDKIKLCKNPDATLKNFNSWALYHFSIEIDWYHTVFFTYTCLDFENVKKCWKLWLNILSCGKTIGNFYAWS